MKTLKGVAAASGVVKGVVCLYTTEAETSIPHYTVPEGGISFEIERLKDAFSKARYDMKDMIKKAKEMFDKEAAEIFTAHLAILTDEELYVKIAHFVRAKRINSEHAVSDIFEEYIQKYSAQRGHFKELIHDFVDTKNMIINILAKEAGRFKCNIGEEKAVIVASKRLTPSMVLNIPKENVLAFVAEEGGLTSHATILARSFGVPIVFGIKVEEELSCGMNAVIDGSLGRMIVEPDAKTDDYYAKKIENIKKRKNICDMRKSLAPQTGTGKRIKLKLNISTPEEVDLIGELQHEGIGLLRTEFLFMQRDVPPSEEEQYKMYKHILGSESEKPVTVRILDISADKMPPFLKPPAGANMDMGLRGSIAVEMYPDLYFTQFRALLRANIHGNLRLLYPMISDVDDMNVFSRILVEARQSLKREKIEFDDTAIKEGVMVETPGAVMMIKEILEKADFINIGSNDLLQYTLAASRGNMMVERKYHILHPALVKMMEMVVKEADKASKEVCLCGEVASFEECYPVLLSVGLKSFSVAVSKFDDIKCGLLHLDPDDKKEILKDYYKLKTREDVEKYLAQYL